MVSVNRFPIKGLFGDRRKLRLEFQAASIQRSSFKEPMLALVLILSELHFFFNLHKTFQLKLVQVIKSLGLFQNKPHIVPSVI
jgi:competence protein ComGF